MEDKFDRITRDPEVVAGQACIRDTGIPVYRVVRLATAGKSTDEILKAFPTLLADDVFQALAYAVGQLQQTITVWRNEGLMPLTNIKGYSDLLLNEAPQPPDQDAAVGEAPADLLAGSTAFTAEQWNRAIRIINADAGRAIVCWSHLADWARTYQEPAIRWQEGMSLQAFVKQEQYLLAQHAPHKTIKAFIPEDLPPALDHGNLKLALVNLLTVDWTPTFTPAVLTAIIAAERSDADTLGITIRRQPDADTQARYAGISPINFYTPGLPWATAALIIHDHGGKFEVFTDQETITFNFTLPVWQEET